MKKINKWQHSLLCITASVLRKSWCYTSNLHMSLLIYHGSTEQNCDDDEQFMSIHSQSDIFGRLIFFQEEIGTFSFNHSSKTTGRKVINFELFFLILYSL